MKKSMCCPPLFILLFITGPLSCFAQIPVSQEPRHHNVFENAWVRVLDVHIPPGDTTLIHKHATPSVFIVLTSTRTGSQVIVEPAEIRLTQGNIWFESFSKEPRIHRVWNSDTSEFHVMDIELPNRHLEPIDPPLALADFKMLFDEKPVRGYRALLEAGNMLEIPPRKAFMLVVRIGKSPGNLSVNGKSLVQSGGFMFLEPGKKLSLVNKSVTPEELGVFELK